LQRLDVRLVCGFNRAQETTDNSLGGFPIIHEAPLLVKQIVSAFDPFRPPETPFLRQVARGTGRHMLASAR
jgi:hypothetical protein